MSDNKGKRNLIIGIIAGIFIGGFLANKWYQGLSPEDKKLLDRKIIDIAGKIGDIFIKAAYTFAKKNGYIDDIEGLVTSPEFPSAIHQANK